MHDDAAGKVGEFVAEGNGLLAESTADVDEDGLFGAGGEGSDFFFHREGFSPVVAALEGHEMTEAGHVVLVLGHPFKSTEVGVEGFLEDGVVSRSDVLVLFLLDETCKGLHNEADIVISRYLFSCAHTVAISFGLNLHISYRTGNIPICEKCADTIGREFVFSGLLDQAESCLGTQNVRFGSLAG